MKAKSILRIVYIVFAAVMAIIVGFMAYNTNGYNYILNKTSNAIKEKNYVEVAKIHGGNFWNQSIVEEDNKDLDVVIYPASTLTNVTYYTNPEKDETKTYHVYENAYYIYTFVNTKMDVSQFSLGGKLTNNTGLKFYTDKNTSYMYYYNISSSINSELYTEKPTSVNASILNSARVLKTYNNWGFFGFTLTESMISAMQTKGLDGSINKVGIIDAAGEELLTLDVNLNFEHEFFEIVKPLVFEYNKYINIQTSSDSTDQQKKQSTQEFNEFYQDRKDANGNVIPGFESKFLANEHCTFRYVDSELQPALLVWQTIGIVVLALVVLALLYMLLFHFKFLKSLISRERWAGKKNLGTKATINKIQNRKENIVSTKAKEVNEKENNFVENKDVDLETNKEEKEETTDNKSE